MNTKLQEKIIELKNAAIVLLRYCGETISNVFDGFEDKVRSNPKDELLLLLVLLTVYEQKFNGENKGIYDKLKSEKASLNNIPVLTLKEETITLEKRISLLNKIIKIVEEIEKEAAISDTNIKDVLLTVNMWKGLLQDCTKERNEALRNLISMCSTNSNDYSKIIECLVLSQDEHIKMMCSIYGLSNPQEKSNHNNRVLRG